MSECQQILRAQGKPYPKTCPVCRLGPCAHALNAAPPAPATTIAALREENARLSDQVYELQQGPWPEWAQDILDILHQRGIVTQFDDEVHLPDAVRDLLNGDDLEREPIAALRADLAAKEAEIARLREAAEKARQHMALIMAFHGRDFGTDRWAETLKQLIEMTVKEEDALCDLLLRRAKEPPHAE